MLWATRQLIADLRAERDYWKGRAETLDNSMDMDSELRAENRALTARLLEVKAAHQATVAHFEWLQVMFNRESAERALISQAKLGVTLPPLRVGHPDAPPDAAHGYHASESFDDSPEPPPGVEPPRVATDDPTLSTLEAEVGASMFEDPGDDKAKDFGARHELDGSVVYER